MIVLSELRSLSLPRGRFLYRESDDEARYGLFGHLDDARVWIRALRHAPPTRAAGPFERADAVRALRLANVEIPDGCELGPWQDGVGFFPVARLPEPAPDGFPIDPHSLEPSITPYVAEDIEDSGVRGCCAAPSYPPKVKWDARRIAPEGIYVRFPTLRPARVGSLTRMWNAHPSGSLVFAPSGALVGGFFVADLP